MASFPCGQPLKTGTLQKEDTCTNKAQYAIHRHAGLSSVVPVVCLEVAGQSDDLAADLAT